ncbi:MAG: phosphatidate cytidylyltransferase [Clostridia bacterium]|nr:phosphatidate cytidylyltransferase [Clostridia bacterium]
MELLRDIISCFGKYLIYLAICLATLLPARRIFRIPQELWRKLLHFVAYTSSLCMMYVSRDWVVSAVCCIIFGAAVYPILVFLERFEGYAHFFNQRHGGEVKKSLLLLFFSHAALIALCWGLWDKPYIAATSIVAWGSGDTMAALIGKPYGRHKIHLPGADPKKSWEGTGAMALTAFVCGFAALSVTSPLGPAKRLLCAVLLAPVAAAAELYSHDGNDTFTVSFAVAFLLGILTM